MDRQCQCVPKKSDVAWGDIGRDQAAIGIIKVPRETVDRRKVWSMFATVGSIPTCTRPFPIYRGSAQPTPDRVLVDVVNG